MTTTIDDETEYAITRGDSDDILITFVNDEDPPVPYDLSKSTDGVADRPAIVRYAVKVRVTDTNENALIIKRSYDDTEIVLMPQDGDVSDPDNTVGQVAVFIDIPDTLGKRPGSYWWDLDVTRQGMLRAGAQSGTLTFDGTAVVVGVGTNFTRAKVGDIVHLTSGAMSGTAVLVARITSSGLMTLDLPFPAETGVTFELRRGFRKTPLRGPFIIGNEVIQ